MDNYDEFNLTLEKDTPAFYEGEKENDPFNHEGYADALTKIVSDNKERGPMVIGLLGPWGCGKSSIINLVKQKIDMEKYSFVYFNAWKYADDSFRRQFILESINELITDEAKRKKEIEKIQKRFVADVINEQCSWREILNANLKPNVRIISSFLLSLIIFIPFFVLGLSFKNPAVYIGSICMAIISFLATNIFPEILTINIPSKIETQLMYPEQFENYFVYFLILRIIGCCIKHQAGM